MKLAHVFRAVSLTSAAALVLSACGGGSSHAVPLPAASSAAQSSAHGTETFTFDVPKDAGSAHSRHPQYVSPATQYMLVDVQSCSGNPATCSEVSGYPQAVGLTTSSGGCVSTLASTECTLSLSLPPGSYEASFTTQDGSHVALSTAQSVAFTITAGTTNTISTTLSGIPVSFGAYAATPNASSFVVNALDADHDVIVGAGAPVFSVATTSGIALTLTQPTAASPNLFSASSTVEGKAIVTVSASYPTGVTNACALSGAVCSAPFTITAAGVAIAPNGGTGIAQFVTPTFAHLANLPVTTSVGSPLSVAFNSSGTLFVGDPNSNSSQTVINEYAAPYSGAPSATIALASGTTPFSLAFDKSNDLFVAELQKGVTEYAPPYTGSPLATITSIPSNVYQVAVNSSGDLFCLQESGDVYELLPPYTGTPTMITTGAYEVGAITIDKADNLYVLNIAPGRIQVYSPPYSSGSDYVPYDPQSPAEATVDTNGTLYAFDAGITGFLVANPPTFSVLPQSGSYTAMAMIPNATTLSISQ